MVLSNKKLKQKLRASVADSITESVSFSTNKSASDTSLKHLIDSATHKPRLSKREKRRVTLPARKTSVDKVLENGGEKRKEEEVVSEGDAVKRKTKRKREDEVENGGVEKVKKDGVKKSKKKGKKKKKKKTKVENGAKSEGVGEKTAGNEIEHSRVTEVGTVDRR